MHDPSAAPNLFYFWDDLATLPLAFQDNIDYARARFPDWNVRLLSDADAPALLSETWPQIAEIYARIWIPACRSDIVRLAALWHYGGWYIDADTKPVGNLRQFDGTKSVIVFRDTRRRLIKRGDVMNGFLHMPKRADLAKATLDGVVENLLENKNQHRVMDFAGPNLLAYFIKLEDPDKIEKLWQRHVYKRYNTVLEGDDPLFEHTVDDTASSWRILQGFGVMSGIAPDWSVFPEELRPRFTAVLRNFANRFSAHDMILQLAEARPLYLERANFARLVSECEAVLAEQVRAAS